MSAVSVAETPVAQGRWMNLGRRWFTPAALAAVVTGLTAWAWTQRFIQDDAFISFRYADNLQRGLGLVWNAGERIEGFSNFLWTLLMAIALRVGAEPVMASYVMGLACFVGSLVSTFLLVRLLTTPALPSGDDRASWMTRGDAFALGTVVLVGTNYSFSAYATGGLETQSQAFLFVASAYLSCRALAPDARRRDLAWLSLSPIGSTRRQPPRACSITGTGCRRTGRSRRPPPASTVRSMARRHRDAPRSLPAACHRSKPRAFRLTLG